MLLSFAQFERVIAGERIRDKIAASKKKGMWMGGNVPLGYDVKDRKLIVNETGASTVRLIFRRYAELGSVALLKAELDRLGIVSKRREGGGGRLAGGQHFSRGALYLMLQNRIYRGEITHQGTAYPGQHEAILDPAAAQSMPYLAQFLVMCAWPAICRSNGCCLRSTCLSLTAVMAASTRL
jgi:site-specific DNA recombinase